MESPSQGKRRILIAGGGYVGLNVARRLERRVPDEAEVVLVDPEGFMIYQPLLAEVASGTVDPRHVAVPLRKVLKRTDLITGHLSGLDHGRRSATIQPAAGAPYQIDYDDVVVALGSVTRLLPVPGLTEQAVGFRSIAEALHLRNQVVSCLEIAEATADPAVRRRALTFVFVGGGYAGVEALAELEFMAREACRYYRDLEPDDMRWILIEATDRILLEMEPQTSRDALDVLVERDIEVRLETTVESAEEGRIKLSDGEEFEADTLVWTAGIEPHPLVGDLGLPIDDKGRLRVDEHLRVKDVGNAWGAGDCASVPNLLTGETCPPTAQYAVRQARALADNIAATCAGDPLEVFGYRSRGEMITLGRKQGLMESRRMKLKGFPAWLLRRAYYVAAMPSFNRRVRVLADWGVGTFFKPEVVRLGTPAEVEREFTSPPGKEDVHAKAG
jgi:NADH:ubiquinone reductase (H+-translocating)